MVSWQVEEWVWAALLSATDPGRAPPNILFVSKATSLVLHWAHALRLACHPVVTHTLYLLPGILVAVHVPQCQGIRCRLLCVRQGKSSHSTPGGLL